MTIAKRLAILSRLATKNSNINTERIPKLDQSNSANSGAASANNSGADSPATATSGTGKNSDGVVDISDAGQVIAPPSKTNQPTGELDSRANRPSGRRIFKPRNRPDNRSASSPSGGQARPFRASNKPFRRPSNHSGQKFGPTGATEGAPTAKVIARAPNNTLRIIPLGGSGETGDKNMLVYEYNNDILIIDAGIKFPDADMPGIDYVICDTTYLEQNKDRIRAFIITHGHEDHIGAMPYIYPKFRVPIFTAPLTAGLIKSKFEEHGIEGADFRIIKPNEKIQIGAFVIEPVRMTHSIPDILGLAITTPVGLIYHATDWKIDFTPPFGEPTDFTKLAELAKRGVLCLLSDSTNVLNPGYTMSEQVVGRALEDIFVKAPGRIIVSSFASRIDRIQHVVTACARTSRKLAISGRSMEKNINIAMELGYLKVPQGVLTDIRSINNLPDHKVIVMCTGSQGEEFSALVRMATGEHRHINIKKGDTVALSSSNVPGNEVAVAATINNLYRLGAEVITNKELDIHSSGHANREEMKLLISLLQPKYLIPIHGEYRYLVEHCKLARGLGMKEENCLIVENGQIAEFDANGGRIAKERAPVGYVLIDGLGVGDVGEIVLRDRQTMAKDGIFLIIMTVDGQKGTLLTSPDIISRGFVYMKESEDLIANTRTQIKKLHELHTGRGTINWEYFKKAMRDDIGEFLFEKTQRRPMVIPVVIQV